MKRIIRFLITLVLCAIFVLQAQAATIEHNGSFESNNEGYKRFLAEHPDVVFKSVGSFYKTTNEILQALLTKTIASDIFYLRTNAVDRVQVMQKGYCADLSGSDVIRDAIGRMHPRIAQQALMNGKIYGVPYDISFYYFEIDENGWAKAGLTEKDIPDSFPAFLDFLESWCDFVQTSQEENIRIRLDWDTSLYNEYSYTTWLVELLIESYIMQMQFANEPLRFHDQELSELLERCKVVGARIYATETIVGDSGGESGVDYSLFNAGLQMAWPQKASHILCFRLNDEQPKLIEASLKMYAVNSGSNNFDLCVNLLEKLVIGPESSSSWVNALLYQNAEPVVNPNYENDLEHWTTRVATFEKQLESNELTLDEKFEIEDQLERSRYYLAYALSGQDKYYMSPSQLEDYSIYADVLYFPAPSVFSASSDTFSTISGLEKQYASGLLTTEQFLDELDRIAYMIAMEEN